MLCAFVDDMCRGVVSELIAYCLIMIYLYVDCNSPSKSPSGSVKTQKKVTVSHIARVLSDVYDSGVQSQCDSGLPLQQKVVICTLLLIVRAVVFKEVLLGKVAGFAFAKAGFLHRPVRDCVCSVWLLHDGGVK